jgi:hypothetical protein
MLSSSIILALSLGIASGGSLSYAASALEQLRSQTAGETTPSGEAKAAPLSIAGSPVSGRVTGIGISHSGDPHDIPDFSPPEMAKLMRELGATHYRPHLPLNEPIKEISPEQLESLRQAQDDPALLEAMVDDLAKNGDWGKMDALVDAFSGQGIKLILVVGAAYVKECPLYTAADGTRRPISPDSLGRPLYLTAMRWLVGAGVRRYSDRVSYWQIENELNAAASVAQFVKWRVNEPSWKNLAFLKDLLQTLGDVVHEEGRSSGRELKTVHNFLCGLPWAPWQGLVSRKKILAPSQTPSHSPVAKSRQDPLDIIGIDSYSNYYLGVPAMGRGLDKHVRDAVSASGGRPVWVLETGFPRGPRMRGFSEERQAKYFSEMFDEAYKSGASLALAFGWFWNPNGWYTDRSGSLPWWHPQAGEQYWSPIETRSGPDGSKQRRFAPAWGEFQRAAERWSGR